MRESDSSLDSALLVSASILFPIVALIAGCAYCRRLCRRNESNDEERQPLLPGEQRGSQTRIERVESEQAIVQRKEPERHSPQPHIATTGKEPEQTEERFEDTRQREAQPMVVTEEAALIPDLLRNNEQEPERFHQSEPDILEPKPFTENMQFPQYEHKEIIVVKERAQQKLPLSLLTDEEPKPVVEQKLESLDKELRNETPQDSKESLLPEQQQDTFAAEMREGLTDLQATESHTARHDSEAVLSQPAQTEDHSPITFEAEEQKPPEKTENADELSAPVQEQPETMRSDDMHETTAALDKEDSKTEEMKTEEQTTQPQEEPSSSTQHQRVTETPHEAETEAEGTVKEQPEQTREPACKDNNREINFDVSPSFVKTMRTKAAKKDSKAIFGLTVLKQELFIISQHSPEVEVFDSQSLAFKHEFHLEDLFDPVDVKSCSKNNCLYIFDWKGESNEIQRVASDGKLITRWKTGDDGGYLSITQEANVILSVWDKNLIKEFTADGQCIRDIQLPATISELRLAIKLSNGHFVVSHGEGEESEHRICLVDDEGLLIQSIGGKQGSSEGEFNNPNYMVATGTGFILVADQNNKRVVLLSPGLEFKQELIQERDGLRYPVRMEMDQTSGRLFIGDNDYLEDHTGWRDGRVIAFDFKIHH